MIDDKLCDEALARIARTPDGRLLYLKLQKVTVGIPSSTKSGALRVNHGRRTLAAELMAGMAEAMTEDASGGSGDPNERPIVYSLARAVPVPGPRGARRRVGPGPRDSDAD